MVSLFGTNGVRGISNETMTVELALRLGRAIGTYIRGDIAVAIDTRTSGIMLKNAVISGLLSTGCNVYDGEHAPSPALQYYVKSSEMDGGVIITASHNPPEFNGIKVIDSDGTELHRKKERDIEDIYFKNEFYQTKWDSIGQLHKVSINKRYIEAILSSVDTKKIRDKQYKVIIDCGNGAGCLTMPSLVGEVANVITINAQPDGLFPGRNSEPTKENIQGLIEQVKTSDADLGIAYDGDADRAIFVDDNGTYVQGDKTLALIAGYMLHDKKGSIVTPISTSQGVEEYIKKHGGNIVYTKVGAPIVSRKMIEINALFGGEENGGLIFPEHQYCRDAGMASLAVLQLLAFENKKLSELITTLPEYTMVKTKISCSDADIMEKLYKKIEKEDVDTTDGLKITLDGGWVLIRLSGTEPIIRIYAEAKNEATANMIIEKYHKLLNELID